MKKGKKKQDHDTYTMVVEEEDSVSNEEEDAFDVLPNEPSFSFNMCPPYGMFSANSFATDGNTFF